MKQDPPNARPSILVAEDDRLVRSTAVALLETQGYQVIEATTAEAALKALGAHPEVRLLFTDVHFPGAKSGLSLACQVRERWPHVAVLVTSGRYAVSPADLPAGARFIAKPYRSAALFGMVDLLLTPGPPPGAVTRRVAGSRG